MPMRKVHRYLVVDQPTKFITILEDELGWFYIAKLPLDQDNIWPNIEMIEQYIGSKLICYKETW